MWKTIAVVLCLAALCFACGEKEAPKDSSSKPAASEKKAEEKVSAEGSKDAPTVTPESKPTPTPEKPALDLPKTSNGGCVQRCVDSRMAEAMGADAIEAECVKECSECIAECVQRRSVEAVGAEVIDQECADDCPEEKP